MNAVFLNFAIRCLAAALGVCLVSCDPPVTRYNSPSSASMRSTSPPGTTEEEIHEALEAKPQLVKEPVIAYYCCSAGGYFNGFGDSLRATFGAGRVVEVNLRAAQTDSVFVKPLFEGFNGYYAFPPASVHQIRLAAAKQRADIIVYCGGINRVKQESNALSLAYLLLAPVLFVPGDNILLHSETDMLCIDVRNGYVYGAFRNEDDVNRDFVFPVANTSTIAGLEQDESRKCVRKLLDELKGILANPENHAEGEK